MKKEKPDIETFAAKMADKEDNPTIHELAKEFPSKSYRELEKFRDADRREEAKQDTNYYNQTIMDSLVQAYGFDKLK